MILSNRDGSSSSLDFATLEGTTLRDLGSGQLTQMSLGSSCYTLLIVFSPSDCPNCLREKTVWEELARAYEPRRLRVVAIMVKTSPAEAQAYWKSFQVPFSVYHDETAALKSKSLVPPITPFKVLFNRDKGVVLADGPSSKSSEQVEFGNRVRSLLGDCAK